MPIEIEKDVPLPTLRADRNRYPFAEMAVGDSFLVSGERSPQKASSACVWTAKKDGRKYVSRTVEGGVRVWRVA